MEKYVLGLAFDESNQHVILLMKNRPSFLAGLWNGVGGHIEHNESAEVAMAREFKEEANIDTHSKQWQLLLKESHDSYEITWYVTQLNQTQLSQLQTMTDEPVKLFSVDELGMMKEYITTDVWNNIQLYLTMPY